MRRNIYYLGAFFACLLFASPPLAQAQVAGDSCAGNASGSVTMGVSQTLVCDGTNYKLMVETDTGGRSNLQIDNDTGNACNSDKLGRLAYDDGLDTWQYCDGTNWTDLVTGAGGLTFEGYTTSSYNGNLGGIKGAHDKCDADFSGSRAMTYDDLLKLGTDYPYTSDAWVLDGSFITTSRGSTTEDPDYTQYSKDGADSYEILDNNNSQRFQCDGWLSSSVGDQGPRVSTTGSVLLNGCSNTYKIACVSGN